MPVQQSSHRCHGSCCRSAGSHPHNSHYRNPQNRCRDRSRNLPQCILSKLNNCSIHTDDLMYLVACHYKSSVMTARPTHPSSWASYNMAAQRRSVSYACLSNSWTVTLANQAVSRTSQTARRTMPMDSSQKADATKQELHHCATSFVSLQRSTKQNMCTWHVHTVVWHFTVCSCHKNILLMPSLPW